MATIEGTSAADILAGMAEDDLIRGLGGNDELRGGGGNDRLDGGSGLDKMYGAKGNDTYFLNAGADTVYEFANEGIDEIVVSFNYVLGANLEYLTLLGTGDVKGIGNGRDNIIVGNRGNNQLIGKGGADVLAGGQGDDTYFEVVPDDTIVERAGEGTDTVYTKGSYTLPPNVEKLYSFGPDGTSAVGNATANEIGGGYNNSELFGRGGDDILRGGDGNNLLDGGVGADRMLGGKGNDVYIVDNAGDRVVDEIYTGVDVVRSSVSFTLSANIEKLVLTGSADVNGTGNASSLNQIFGNAGDNVLDGKGGQDTLTGGKGNDSYVVDDSKDTIVELTGEGIDHVFSSTGFVLPNHVENITLIGTGNGAYGNAGGNKIVGNAYANILDGKGGADKMVGRGGNDTYYVDDAGDKVVELAGQGTDEVFSLVSFVLPAGVENLTLAGSGNLNATGNAQNNVIVGNGAANRLDGGAGADRMEGKQGDDTYIVDNVGDKVFEVGRSSGDSVISSVSFSIENSGDVENLTLVGTAANATGNELDNVIIGNASNNVIRGQWGSDTIKAGAGNDTVYCSDGDVVTLGAGADRIFVDVVGFDPAGKIKDFASGIDKIFVRSGWSYSYDQATGAMLVDTGFGPSPYLQLTPGTPLLSTDVIVY